MIESSLSEAFYKIKPGLASGFVMEPAAAQR